MTTPLTFVLTGALSRPRAEIAAQIARAGHLVSNSVTTKTDYLVVGDDPGAKVGKAEACGVTMINEEAITEVLASPRRRAEVEPLPDRFADVLAPRVRVIYHLRVDDHEVEGMFDESGNLLGAWFLNDAHWRSEYMNGFMKLLGITIKRLPKAREPAARKAIAEMYGYEDGGEF